MSYGASVLTPLTLEDLSNDLMVTAVAESASRARSSRDQHHSSDGLRQTVDEGIHNYNNNGSYGADEIENNSVNTMMVGDSGGGATGGDAVQQEQPQQQLLLYKRPPQNHLLYPPPQLVNVLHPQNQHGWGHANSNNSNTTTTISYSLSTQSMPPTASNPQPQYGISGGGGNCTSSNVVRLHSRLSGTMPVVVASGKGGGLTSATSNSTTNNDQSGSGFSSTSFTSPPPTYSTQHVKGTFSLTAINPTAECRAHTCVVELTAEGLAPSSAYCLLCHETTTTENSSSSSSSTGGASGEDGLHHMFCCGESQNVLMWEMGCNFSSSGKMGIDGGAASGTMMGGNAGALAAGARGGANHPGPHTVRTLIPPVVDVRCGSVQPAVTSTQSCGGGGVAPNASSNNLAAFGKTGAPISIVPELTSAGSNTQQAANKEGEFSFTSGAVHATGSGSQQPNVVKPPQRPSTMRREENTTTAKTGAAVHPSFSSNSNTAFGTGLGATVSGVVSTSQFAPIAPIHTIMVFRSDKFGRAELSFSDMRLVPSAFIGRRVAIHAAEAAMRGGYPQGMPAPPGSGGGFDINNSASSFANTSHSTNAALAAAAAKGTGGIGSSGSATAATTGGGAQHNAGSSAPSSMSSSSIGVQSGSKQQRTAGAGPGAAGGGGGGGDLSVSAVLTPTSGASSTANRSIVASSDILMCLV